MWRLGAIETTLPPVRANRALCEAEILARAAALIVPQSFVPDADFSI